MSDKILDRVRKMLNLANHPNTSAEEREAFLEKADALMVKHAIDEAMLAATQTQAERRTPVSETINLFEKGKHSSRFRTIFQEVCASTRVRCSFRWASGKEQAVTVVGFREDVEYAQLLFTTIQYAFIAKIRPTWNPEAPVGENVYNFKVAGYAWSDIYHTAQIGGVECSEARETLWSPYDTYVRRNGLEKVKTNRFGAYKESFADAFVNRMCARLEALRDTATAQAASSGAELVLVRSKEEVDAEFYRLFPDERPMSAEELQRRREAWDRQREEEKEREAARINAMTAKEREAYEQERRRKAKEDAAYWRKVSADSARRYDSAGSRAGASAADSVNLSRPGPAADSSSRKPLA
jgi:hypothetical protein